MFNVITPFSRIENLEKLTNHLRTKNIKWYIITDKDSNIKINLNEPWIQHFECPNINGTFYEKCNNAINWFVENHNLNEEEYYGILNDDDGYEDDFFVKLHKEVDKSNLEKKFNDLLIISMKRGHNIPMDAIPVRRHPNNTLIAAPHNMKVGGVGVEQFLIKGKHLKKHRIPLTPTGDGSFISELVRTYGAMYLPEIYVLFNYFEPGRWNK